MFNKNSFHRPLFIGPMTKNVVDAAMDEKFLHTVGLIPSRRQIDFLRGYVNNWSTAEFLKYTKKSNVVRCRDHSGPLQGQYSDDGKESLKFDCIDENHFEIIHIDPWRSNGSIEDVASLTTDLIRECHKNCQDVLFEVGTEEGIRPYTEKELEVFLKILKKDLGGLYEKILYCVIQGGTLLKGIGNAGTFDYARCKRMIDVSKSAGLLSKEHNGDYISSSVLSEKFQIGLDSLNVAPEFGLNETKAILERLNKEDFELFFEICYESSKWKKWLGENFKIESQEDKRQLILSCGHYVMSNDKFLELKNRNDLEKVDLVSIHKERIENILKVIDNSKHL